MRSPFAVGVFGILALCGVAASADAQVVSGDGRGLASFGDRGLTTFGDRFTEGFGRRPLASFGDIPLAPMGGLKIDRAPATPKSPGKGQGERPFARSRRMAPSAKGQARASSHRRERSHASVASIRGVNLAPFEPRTTIVALPTVTLPVATLDPKPSIDELEAELARELARGRARGDLDLARTLAASLRR